jgi:hypothetical protein
MPETKDSEEPELQGLKSSTTEVEALLLEAASPVKSVEVTLDEDDLRRLANREVSLMDAVNLGFGYLLGAILAVIAQIDYKRRTDTVSVSTIKKTKNGDSIGST